MSSVFKPTFTKPLPDNAELFTRKGEQFARWQDSTGKSRTASVTVPTAGKHAGQPRIVAQASKYFARFRDADGTVQVKPTGCKDRTAALGVLRELERAVELVKGNVLTKSESRTSAHADVPLAEHFAAYDEHLQNHVGESGFSATARHRRLRQDHLKRVAFDLGWTRIPDLDRVELERWLADQAAKNKRGARTRNSYAASWSAFGNWCVDTHRLISSPFARLGQANEKSDTRRKRRALNATELLRLLDASWRRPLAEHGRKAQAVSPAKGKKRKRSNWTREPVTPDTLAEAEEAARRRFADRPEMVAELERLGKWRALCWKMMALTGLRLNELRSLTIGQATLSGPAPCVILKPADEKARRGAEIMLRSDLAADLARHLKERLAIAQNEARRESQPVPMTLPTDEPLLFVGRDLIRILDKDLRAAGLPKRDDRNQTFDVHAFRTTFNSLLAAAGVPLADRQRLMRHAADTVTDEHYSDLRLIDLRKHLDKLPRLPLDDGRERLRATGTDHSRSQSVEGYASPACTAACYGSGDSSYFGQSTDKMDGNASLAGTSVSDDPEAPCGLLTSPDSQRANGLEPSTFSLEG